MPPGEIKVAMHVAAMMTFERWKCGPRRSAVPKPMVVTVVANAVHIQLMRRNWGSFPPTAAARWRKSAPPTCGSPRASSPASGMSQDVPTRPAAKSPKAAATGVLGWAVAPFTRGRLASPHAEGSTRSKGKRKPLQTTALASRRGARSTQRRSRSPHARSRDENRQEPEHGRQEPQARRTFTAGAR